MEMFNVGSEGIDSSASIIIIFIMCIWKYIIGWSCLIVNCSSDPSQIGLENLFMPTEKKKRNSHTVFFCFNFYPYLFVKEAFMKRD